MKIFNQIIAGFALLFLFSETGTAFYATDSLSGIGSFNGEISITSYGGFGTSYSSTSELLKGFKEEEGVIIDSETKIVTKNGSTGYRWWKDGVVEINEEINKNTQVLIEKEIIIKKEIIKNTLEAKNLTEEVKTAKVDLEKEPVVKLEKTKTLKSFVKPDVIKKSKLKKVEKNKVSNNFTTNSTKINTNGFDQALIKEEGGDNLHGTAGFSRGFSKYERKTYSYLLYLALILLLIEIILIKNYEKFNFKIKNLSSK